MNAARKVISLGAAGRDFHIFNVRIDASDGGSPSLAAIVMRKLAKA